MVKTLFIIFCTLKLEFPFNTKHFVAIWQMFSDRHLHFLCTVQVIPSLSVLYFSVYKAIRRNICIDYTGLWIINDPKL